MKKGLTTNAVKIIAIIIVVIDHIGLYLYPKFSQDTYYILRTIGRAAMPIFTYFIVQGYLYTKNLKKYILRIFILALITQVILFILGYINNQYYPNYWTGVNNYLGILFSYTLSLILLAVFDKKIWIEKLTENQNWILRITAFILVALAYTKLNIEFGMRIPFMIITIFAIEKLFTKDNQTLKKRPNKEQKENILYLALILAIIAISLLFITYTPGNQYAALAAIIPIALYNGQKGRNNKPIQLLFYAIFPLQHLILYLTAILT